MAYSWSPKATKKLYKKGVKEEVAIHLKLSASLGQPGVHARKCVHELTCGKEQQTREVGGGRKMSAKESQEHDDEA